MLSGIDFIQGCELSISNKSPTIRDVAIVAGVSRATAARVLNEQKEIIVKKDTRNRVLLAAADLGYIQNTVAASLRTKKTHNVAISIPDISNPFFPELVRGAQDVFSMHNYNLIMFNNDWDEKIEKRHFEVIRKTLADGLILSPSRSDLSHTIFPNIPIVILGDGLSYPSLDSVGNDSKGGVLLALNHLFDLGHRHIGLVVGGSLRKTSSSRIEMYEKFHFERNLKLRQNYIARIEFGIRASDSIEKAKKSVLEILRQKHPPTAIFASNDVLALAVLKAAFELKICVPKNLSLIGMDDIFSASASTPAITTVSKERYKLGQLSAKRLIYKLSNVDLELPERILMPCGLLERGTVSAPFNI